MKGSSIFNGISWVQQLMGGLGCGEVHRLVIFINLPPISVKLEVNSVEQRSGLREEGGVQM